jgi:hypothetical protein
LELNPIKIEYKFAKFGIGRFAVHRIEKRAIGNLSQRGLR